MGMAWIARVSRHLTGLADDIVVLHDELLRSLQLPTSYDGDFAKLRHVMSLDKKARGQALRLVCLREVGSPTIVVSPDEGVLEACYAELA